MKIVYEALRTTVLLYDACVEGRERLFVTGGLLLIFVTPS